MKGTLKIYAALAFALLLALLAVGSPVQAAPAGAAPSASALLVPGEGLEDPFLSEAGVSSLSFELDQTGAVRVLGTSAWSPRPAAPASAPARVAKAVHLAPIYVTVHRSNTNGILAYERRVGRSLASRGGRPRVRRVSSGYVDIAPLIEAAAAKYNLDPRLIVAVIKVESGFNVYAVSCSGAQGLMQMIPSTAASMNVNDSFDPAQNIMGGARYLRMLIDRFGSLELAVAAYNVGPGNVSRGYIPASASYYVSKVMRAYGR